MKRSIGKNPFLQVAPFNKAIESQRRYEALRKISQKNFQLETGNEQTNNPK